MQVSRRGVLVGGGAGVGLIVAWGVWPRDYPPNLTAEPGEHAFGAWLKIATDGRVTVAVPQAEHGQGSYTALAQIVADELGADWRTVGVEPAPLNPVYANPLGVAELWEGLLAYAPGTAPQLTAASTSVRMFEGPCRRAAAAARVLLLRAAATHWNVDWSACRVEAGFVLHDGGRLRFAELAAAAAAAAGGTAPDPIPLGGQGAGRLSGRALPRLDTPAKVDGSFNFAGDVRLPDMVHAASRLGPAGQTRLLDTRRAAAERMPGVVAVVERPGWVAVAATTHWTAERALAALAPRFATEPPVVDSHDIEHALDAALAAPGLTLAAKGDVGSHLAGESAVTATYRTAPGVHAAIETPAATAHFSGGRLQLWLPTQAPGLARAAAARIAGIGVEAVTIHPMPIGGSFGRALESDIAEQATVLAVELKRPVSLIWSRGEDLLNDAYRAPMVARLTARLAHGGAIAAWRAEVATPAVGRQLAGRLMPEWRTKVALALDRGADPYALGGALPPYDLPVHAIVHHPAELPPVWGHVRGGAHVATCFATECFVDELAQAAGGEALAYRLAMLGADPRLARCLSTAAALGGWQGGVGGSGQGLACHAFRGSRVAVLAEAAVQGGAVRVSRLVAAVDCGRVINPALVRQQIEGGLIFGLAAATGAVTGFTRGVADVRRLGQLGLPRLADTPDITVELIRSDAPPGGVSELAVPPVAPAIANALFAATGGRWRTLPLRRPA